MMVAGGVPLKGVLDLEIIRNIFDALEEGVFIVDKDCRILFYNKTLSRLEGLEPNYVVGKSMFEVFPSITPQESTLQRVMQTGKPIIGRFQQYINYLGKHAPFNKTFKMGESEVKFAFWFTEGF
ncbi:MAG: PAS domain-containing protein [Bacillota bacterium]